MGKQSIQFVDMHGLHSHHGFEFHFSFTSKGLMLVEDHHYAVLPGKVFIIRPLVYHYVQPLLKSDYKRKVLSIEESFFNDLLESNAEIISIFRSWFTMQDVVFVEFTIDHRELLTIEGILLNLEQELNERRKGYTFYAKALIIQVMLLLERARGSCVTKERAPSEMREITGKMMEYIKKHCCEALGMTELANNFHISKSYMFKIFKMFTGYTPYQYLMLQRISRAKTMLDHGKDSITQIAARTGFNDSSHFIRTFKEATNMTPGEFKNTSEHISV